jgi:hypothetical protein
MSKKLLLSVLMSAGIVVGGFGVAYAFGTFNAIEQGFRQGGEGQAGKLTMVVEAGTADANSDFLPDSYNCNAACPGGALSFAITNTSDVPIRVTKLEQATKTCGIAQCQILASNKNTDGTYAPAGTSGSCVTDFFTALPTSFDNWPSIGPHSTLQVNGTDNNQLGAGMIHMNYFTPDGCQGALFTVGLKVTATEISGAAAGNGFLP